MKIAHRGLLAALLLALLAACGPAQPPQTSSEATSPAATSGASPQGSGAYPTPAAYPGASDPAAAPTDGPLVIPEPSSTEVGVISGVLLRRKEDGTTEPVSRGVLYLGGLVPDANGVNSMVGVDKSVDPQAPLNSRGEFVFVDVPPGRYGLMYDNLEGMLLLNHPETSSDFLIDVVGGQSQELGELVYPLPAQ